MLWEGVGDFIHDTLRVPVSDVCQDDIETVIRVDNNGLSDIVDDEVIVTFFDKKKRDMVMVNSPNLADCIDPEREPTAGIRLEIPDEPHDTFRLVSRFDTRLRARHGKGTKHHIKFDDFAGSHFANIKLPGDNTWTRVTPDMARADLEALLREESFHQKRMATKLVPGPRERLSRPLGALVPAARAPPAMVASCPGDQSEGRRPRWTAPERRPYDRRRE